MGKVCHCGANNDTRRSNQNSQPLLCDKYPLGNLFLKLFLFFPLSHFVKPTFFLLFSRGGRFSWGVELRNATSDVNRASTTFLQQPNGSESWDFRQLKKNFEFFISIKLSFHCTLYKYQIDVGRFLRSWPFSTKKEKMPKNWHTRCAK